MKEENKGKMNKKERKKTEKWETHTYSGTLPPFFFLISKMGPPITLFSDMLS
jgi:hypothetical protein